MRRQEDHLSVYPHSGKCKAGKPESWFFLWPLQALSPTQPGMFFPFSPGKWVSVIHTSVLKGLPTSGAFFPNTWMKSGFSLSGRGSGGGDVILEGRPCVRRGLCPSPHTDPLRKV